MMTFFKSCGPFLVPQLIVLAVIVVRTVMLARAGRTADHDERSEAAASLPFWGGVGLVLGLMGQGTGLYNALSAISRASAISPAVIAQGLAESFSTTLVGLTILLVALLAWLGVRIAAGRATAPA